MPELKHVKERVKQGAFSKEPKKSFAERLSARNKVPGIGTYKTDKAYTLLSPSPTARRRV